MDICQRYCLVQDIQALINFSSECYKSSRIVFNSARRYKKIHELEKEFENALV